ncbi:MAG: hypothetical protein KGL35_21460, partial [Bradyrhizobium sp.]|nr:hypothetical protein [Bradyrhizobium sp.]
RRALYRGWRMLLQLAGLPIDRRQGPQKLRRSAATHLCREHGIEAASMLLGHLSDVDLARRNYIDATMGYALPPLPPSLPLKARPVALIGGPSDA